MKNIDSAIKKVSALLNIPEEKVKPVIMEYWENIYKKILKGEETTITARHIGTFTVSHYKLRPYILEKLRKIRNYKIAVNITEEKRIECITEETEKLRKALVHRNELAIQYAKMFKNI